MLNYSILQYYKYVRLKNIKEDIINPYITQISVEKYMKKKYGLEIYFKKYNFSSWVKKYTIRQDKMYQNYVQMKKNSN